jgi:hypothetical protein
LLYLSSLALSPTAAANRRIWLAKFKPEITPLSIPTNFAPLPVAIPVALQDAMSRQAQAEREKQARVILGSAEAAIAGKFVEAAMTYADHPMALQLRAMNIIYETTKERGATILIPTSMIDSLNPVVALALAGQETASQKANEPLPLINRSH